MVTDQYQRSSIGRGVNFHQQPITAGSVKLEPRHVGALLDFYDRAASVVSSRARGHVRRTDGNVQI